MDSGKKSSRYERVYQQLTELLTKTPDPIARMATIAALLSHKFDYYFWCGFYRLVEGELTVGPYQGAVACQVLKAHTGVCWAGIDQQKTVIVPDVHLFSGHIACDAKSNSEIVVPVRDKTGRVYAVLDVDSTDFSSFDETDARWLEKIIPLINN
ncbi:MAG: GAF domain-containing protein [Bacteroidetes bacterium]|nr:GAF domain-containing protein [Bacteroidota bacterium]